MAVPTMEESALCSQLIERVKDYFQSAEHKKEFEEWYKDFCLCNALKYIYRHRRKNGLEDIQKAIWYLNKAVELDGQIKELIDCRTIGESEPRYMEGRSNEEI